MEPNANPGQNFESAPARPVVPEQQPQAPLEQAPPAPSPESLTQTGNGANQGAPSMVLPPPVLKPAPAPQVAPVSADPAAAPAATPNVADDVDVIEKEWVDKAKQIVDKTTGDPHRQNKEVSVLKADYMKKRYNKDIKLQDNS